jgi:hypothetical protein
MSTVPTSPERTSDFLKEISRSRCYASGGFALFSRRTAADAPHASRQRRSLARTWRVLRTAPRRVIHCFRFFRGFMDWACNSTSVTCAFVRVSVCESPKADHRSCGICTGVRCRRCCHLRFGHRRSWLTLRFKPPIAARSNRTSPSHIRHHFGNALAILRSDRDQHRCSRRPIPIGRLYPDEAVVVPAEGARDRRTLRCDPCCGSRRRYIRAMRWADQAAPPSPDRKNAARP